MKYSVCMILIVASLTGAFGQLNTPLIGGQADSIDYSPNGQFLYALGLGGHVDDSGEDEELRPVFEASFVYSIKRFLQWGIGANYYRFADLKALPVYLKYSGQLSAVQGKGWFYYVAYGTSKVWADEVDYPFREVKGSRILKGGLGYRAPVENSRLSISFTFGWLQQQVKERYGYSYYYFDTFNSSFAPAFETTVKRRLNGLEFKIGLEF